ncbi:hypothetical protein BDQ17DRAFT_1358798 [Cyathus striatus]|nr:hypothetical protein BDQ17DRAFT_1358798 [Cyathus striatus]
MSACAVGPLRTWAFECCFRPGRSWKRGRSDERVCHLVVKSSGVGFCTMVLCSFCQPVE